MTLNFEGLNYLAILTAAAATFVLGGLWYTALFGKKWADLHDYTPERMEEIRAKKPPPLFFGTMLVCYVIVSIATAVLASSMNINTVPGGAGLGLVLWVLAAAIGLTGHIAEDRHIGIYIIDTAYQLIYLTGTGAIIGAWR